MRDSRKRVSFLRPIDFLASPVWQFAGSDDDGEPMVVPVNARRVKSLKNRVVGTMGKLSCGEEVPLVLGNFDCCNAEVTRHFLSVSVFSKDAWFHLARYFDPWLATHGPEALAASLGRSLDDTFPMSYDIAAHLHAPRSHSSGRIERYCSSPLSPEERIELLFMTD